MVAVSGGKYIVYIIIRNRFCICLRFNSEAMNFKDKMTVTGELLLKSQHGSIMVDYT